MHIIIPSEQLNVLSTHWQCFLLGVAHLLHPLRLEVRPAGTAESHAAFGGIERCGKQLWCVAEAFSYACSITRLSFTGFTLGCRRLRTSCATLFAWFWDRLYVSMGHLWHMLHVLSSGYMELPRFRLSSGDLLLGQAPRSIAASPEVWMGASAESLRMAANSDETPGFPAWASR